MVAAASELEDEPEPELRARLADRLLRFSLFQPGVDRLAVVMRKVERVHRNVDSVERGPLSEKERTWLLSVKGRAETEG